MKPTHDQEDCPCPLCFRRDLMEQVLGYYAATDTTVFEIVGLLQSMQFDLLQTMGAAQAQAADCDPNLDHKPGNN